MSRSTTTSGTAPQTGKTAQTTPQASATQSSVPMDKVAKRAYEKWMQTGCKHGCDKQHWHEAEQEIKAEMARTQKR
jgi:Protein of unknown function (DUF2934)